MLTHITEESFFKCLTWLCHAVCGVILSILVGENFLYLLEYESSITYSNCARFLLFSRSRSYKLYGILQMAIALLNLVAHISIFFQQKQLAKQSASEWVVSYSTNGVKFEKKKKPSSRILWKHNRNVVSHLGSFLSHLVAIIFHAIVSSIYYDVGPSWPPIVGQFLFFLRHSLYFFGLNFIETLSSPTLRRSLFDIILWWRHHRDMQQIRYVPLRYNILC